MNLELNNQSVLITGSGSGIGRGLAEGFLKEKALVILSDLNEKFLDNTAEELSSSYDRDRVLKFFGDLNEPEILENLYQFIIEKAKGLDHLVCNIGDALARWTNDRWTSTLHRVVVPPSDAANVRRQSIGYFLHPNYDADVACLETCTSPDNPPKYPPVTAGAEMFKKLRSRIAGGQNDAAQRD